MDIEKVNAYLSFAVKCLVKGGCFNSNNQIYSRHIRNNNLDNYDVSAYDQVNILKTPLHSHLSISTGAAGEHACLRARKIK